MWLNLFKDFVNCLYWGHHFVVVAGPQFPYDLPVRQAWTWNRAPSPQASQHFSAIWERARDELQLSQFANGLEKHGRKVRKDELAHYLSVINRSMSGMILQSFFDNGMLTPPEGYEHKFEILPLTAPPLPQDEDSAFIEAMYEEMHASLAVYRDYHALLLDNRNESNENAVLQRNWDRLRIDFPYIYVRELSRLIQPDSYAACFTKTPHSSSMWSHYADGHRGACLIFDAEDRISEDSDKSDAPSLSIRQITGGSWNEREGHRDNWSFAPMTFQEMRYADKPAEVNFFTEIGNLTGQDLLDLWYSGEDGNVSALGSHVINPHDRDVWREDHWAVFHRDLIFKTREWEYEQEHRLVYYHALMPGLDANDRTLTYDFKSLSGVIFGMRMSAVDKREIVEIIAAKCREQNRDSFPFYQAYYSPHRGEIRYERIFTYTADIARSGSSRSQ